MELSLAHSPQVFSLARQSACRELGVGTEFSLEPILFWKDERWSPGCLFAFDCSLLRLGSTWGSSGARASEEHTLWKLEHTRIHGSVSGTQPGSEHWCGVPSHFLNQLTALSVCSPGEQQAPLSLGAWCLVSSSHRRHG